MKTQIIPLLAVSLLIMLGCTKDEYRHLLADPESYRLCKVLNYSSSSDPTPHTFMELSYSENGNLILEALYDYPNTLFTYRTYEYDRNNALVKESIYDGEVGNLRLGTYITYAHENGNLITKLYLADGTWIRTEHFEYEGENLVNTYKTDASCGIYHQYKYTYNNLNLLVLEECFMYNGELEHTTKYTYDESSRKVKTEIFNHIGETTQTVEHNYTGSSTLPTEELYYDLLGNLTQHRKLIYDAYENLTEIRILKDHGTPALFKKKFVGKLLIEHITYSPAWGYAEWGVSRYEYEKYPK